MIVQLAKQTAFCHVQTAVEGSHPFFTQEMSSFLPLIAMNTTALRRRLVVIVGQLYDINYFSHLKVKHQYGDTSANENNSFRNRIR